MSSKNINIVYNVDTSSVKVATDSVTQAKLATDQLTQSAQKFNDQATSGFKATGVLVGDLKGELVALKTQIEQTDIADKARLQALGNQYKQIQSQLDEYNKGLQTTQANTQSVAAGFSSLYTTVKAVITAGLLKELVTVNLEMAKLAGQTEGVKRAFDRLPNSILLMDELRKSTHGASDDLTLMINAVKASNFHIPLESLGKLFEFISIKSQQGAGDIDYLMNSLINGLARGSNRLLEHLGFTMVELRENTKKYGSTTEGVMALINAKMAELSKDGGYIDTSKTKVDQLSAAWVNLKIAASQTFASTGFVEVLDRIVLNLTGILKGSKAVNDEFNKGIAIQYANDFLNKQKQTEESIQSEIDSIKKQMQVRGALKATIKEQYEALQPLNHEDDEKRKRMQDMYSTLARQNDISQKEILILQQKQSQLQSSNKDEKEQVGLIEALDEKIKQLNEDLIKTTSRKNIIEIQVQIKQAEAEKADLLDPDRMARQAKEAFDKTNAAIQEGIRSNVETIIKEAGKGAKGIEENSLFKELNKSMMSDIKMFINGLKKGMKEASDEEKKGKADFDKFLIASSRYAKEIANAIVAGDSQKYDAEIQNLQDYYSRQEELAGNNSKRVAQLQKEEKAKEDKLREEQKAAQKKDAILRIEIDTAANIIKSIAQLGVPWGLVLGAEAAALGAIQIANVNKFAKGVIDLKGPGTETSDSIPSLLSRGESVMTAEETRNSGNILRNIRSKKLNDNVIEKLTLTADGVIFKPDNSDVVSAIKANKSPDLVKKFGVIYEAKEESKNMRRIIRSKSFTG